MEKLRPQVGSFLPLTQFELALSIDNHAKFVEAYTEI